MSKLLLTVVLCFFIAKDSQAAQIEITVWNYYLTPPFYTAEGEGLAVDMVNFLNSVTSKYRFRLSSIPRARLNKLLAEEQQGIVLFVNKRWMPSTKAYLWTPALTFDQNEVISTVDNKINYQSYHSLAGHVFGAVRGRVFEQLQPLFSTNIATRVDVNREEQLIKLLLRGRIDVTSLPRATISSLCRKLNIQGQLHFSESPLYIFSRHVMLTPKLTMLHQELTGITTTLASNPHWQMLIKKYQLAITREQLQRPVSACF